MSLIVLKFLISAVFVTDFFLGPYPLPVKSSVLTYSFLESTRIQRSNNDMREQRAVTGYIC